MAEDDGGFVCIGIEGGTEGGWVATEPVAICWSVCLTGRIFPLNGKTILAKASLPWLILRFGLNW